jgi:hypothetical protein
MMNDDGLRLKIELIIVGQYCTMISYNSLLLYARNSEALIVSEREQVCWTLQKFFNNEKTRSAAAEEGWTRTTKHAASHHIPNRSVHL